MLAREAGFASAVTALPGIVLAEGRSNLHALPRIAWDGRQRSLRAMRVMLSGDSSACVPSRAVPFQPRQAHEITPEFLDRTIHALKRWKFDIVGMDEVCQRAAGPKTPRRFVCLTFDGATRDLMVSAYPVLARHGVPFTVYVPTAFPDGLGEAWWLALEAVIARNDRIALVMDRKERRFEIADVDEKYRLYDFLQQWMRSLGPEDLSAAINDLCKRYSVDLAELSREASMSWDDLAKLARRSERDDRKHDREFPGPDQLEGCGRLARNLDGQGGGAIRVPPRHHAFRLSVWRPRIVQSAACDAGPRGRLCQRGDGAAGCGARPTAARTCTRCRASPGTDGSVRCAPCG